MTETPVNDPLVEVLLSSIVTRLNSQQQLIKLKEKAGDRTFPIVIGMPEAAEIRRVVKGQETERPMTHELLIKTIEGLDARLQRVDIVDLRNHTFFARLVIAREGGEEHLVVDARPSDAIALALRAGATLSVAESVLAEVRTDQAPDPIEGDEPEDGEDETDDETEDAGEDEGPELP